MAKSNNYVGELKPGDTVEISLGMLHWAERKIESVNKKTARFDQPIRQGYVTYYGLVQGAKQQWFLEWERAALVYKKEAAVVVSDLQP